MTRPQSRTIKDPRWAVVSALPTVWLIRRDQLGTFDRLLCWSVSEGGCAFGPDTYADDVGRNHRQARQPAE